MADDPDPPTVRVPRARTNPGIAPRNRDELSDAARAEHARAIPKFAGDDITGQVMALSGEEFEDSETSDVTPEEKAELLEQRLYAAREGRPTMQRVRHLERKVDKIVPDIAYMKGVLEVLPGHVQDAAEAARAAAAAAMAVANARQVATVTTTVETEGARAVGGIQVATAEQLDKIDKEKTVRRVGLTILKIIAGLASGGGIVELLHQLGGK